jgi:RND family efflux transporter MFP subunit
MLLKTLAQLFITVSVFCFTTINCYAVTISLKSLGKLVIYPHVEAPALVVSLNDSALGAAVNGVVSDIPARVGDLVQKGSVLVQLNADDLELEKIRLDVRLKRVAKQKSSSWSTLQSRRKLAKSGSVSKSALKKSETDYAVLQLDYQDTQAQVQLAANKVERSAVKAPFTGIVTKRLGRVGEFVSPGKPLVQLVDVDNIAVSANVQSKDVPSLSKAREIVFLFANKKLPLKLRSVVKIRDQKTRTQEVRLEFTKKEELPGTAGRVRWKHTQPHIPPSIMVRRNSQLGIFILKGKKAHFLPLKGALEGRPVPTTLSLSTKIVVDGRFSIKDGLKLKQ